MSNQRPENRNPSLLKPRQNQSQKTLSYWMSAGVLLMAGIAGIVSVFSVEGTTEVPSSISIPRIIMPALDYLETDAITLTSSSGTLGSSTEYVLTDENGVILQVQSSSPSFGTLSAGGYLAYAITYDGTPNFLSIGDTISQVSSSGCIALSSPLPLVVYFAATFNNVDPITAPPTTPPGSTNSCEYFLVNSSGNILEKNSSPNFSAQSDGDYFVYSLCGTDVYTPNLGDRLDTLTVPGTYYFSDPYPITVNSSLFPVEWLSFSAKWIKEGSLLTWVTVSELNADVYEVERSLDRNSFETIGKVAASGTTQEVSSYSFTDTESRALAGDRIYYRLKQMDIDGVFEYSAIVELSLGAEISLGLSAYPNPTSATLNLSFIPDGAMQVSIVNSNGQEMMKRSVKVDEREISLQVEEWPAGMYFVRLLGEKASESLSFVKR